jgi:Cu(I)/Ag(I) efflux system membrane fusion protein
MPLSLYNVGKYLAIPAVALAAFIGWMFGHSQTRAPAISAPLYYQSPMHPWVKSSRPGKCTVCGMDLVPVYRPSSGGRAYEEDGQSRAESAEVLLPQSSPALLGVRAVPVVQRTIVRTLRLSGVVEDDDSRHRILSASVAGRIERLSVSSEGAEVVEGQPLATIYSWDLAAVAAEYRALVGSGHAADSLVLGARNRLRQMGLNGAQIDLIPESRGDGLEFEILSPRTGTVVRRSAYAGQYVVEGERLFELADFSTMWIQLFVAEQDIAFVRVGHRVEVSMPSLPGKTFSAAVSFISPNMDERNRTARVRVELENPEGKGGLRYVLLHRALATAQLTVEVAEALAVPRSAVLWPGSGPLVYVESGEGRYERRKVHLGRQGDSFWEVLEGVHEGEFVVVSGNLLIDAQAQLDHLGDSEQKAPPGGGANAGRSRASPGVAFSSAQTGGSKEVIDPHRPASGSDAQERNFILAVIAAGEALAADDLNGYRLALGRVPEPPLSGVRKTPDGASSLSEARLGFLPWSESVVDWFQTRRPLLPEVRVYRCPMSDALGGGAPKNARWIQRGTAIQNPYMGREMLECGVEVRP